VIKAYMAHLLMSAGSTASEMTHGKNQNWVKSPKSARWSMTSESQVRMSIWAEVSEAFTNNYRTYINSRSDLGRYAQKVGLERVEAKLAQAQSQVPTGRTTRDAEGEAEGVDRPEVPVAQ
jgi:hypothetical protein